MADPKEIRAMPHPKVKKAVIAAAGFGTRFLPQTKAMPKEMLPIIDKPVIQYIVEDLIDAGIEDIVIVTGDHKRAVEDHFDTPSRELVRLLSSDGKEELLREVERIANLANFAYVRQKGPSGNATPLLNAARLLGDEPFIYTFGDDFIKARPGRFRQMVDVSQRSGLGVLSCIRAEQDADYDRYGFVGGIELEDGLIKVDSILEKPGKDKAPSDLASVSSYIFMPSILDYLEDERRRVRDGEEFSLQAVMQAYVDRGNYLLAYEVRNAKYYDSGNKLEYLKTIVDIALDHDTIGAEFRAYLRERLAKDEGELST
jgi:UTP--glucose-1-phosphate uridylyltransferase